MLSTKIISIFWSYIIINQTLAFLIRLKQLVDIVSTFKLQYLQLVGRQNDKATQLYELLKKGRVKNNEDARKRLYPGSKNAVALLSKTKRRLFNQLINSTIVTQHNIRSEYESSLYEAYKYLAAYRIIRTQGMMKAANYVAEDALKTALKYDFTDIIYLLSRQLRRHYSAIDKNEEKRKFYSELANRYGEEMQVENQLEEIYSQLSARFGADRRYEGDKAFIHQILEETPLPQESHYWSSFLYFNIRVISYQVLNDHSKIIEECEKAIELMESLGQKAPPITSFFFLSYQIPSLILQKSSVQPKIDQALAFFEPGHVNWQHIKRFETLNHFHHGQYQKALEVVDQVKQFKHAEIWLVYEAMAKLLSNKSIRLYKLLNEIPVISQDKRGMNINILILEVLYHLNKQEYGKIIDRMPSIEQYLYRHLMVQPLIRSRLFVKMLMSLEKGHFRRKAVEEKSRDLLEELRSYPIDQSVQDFELEVVPYEVLWGEVLGRLE